MQTGTDAHGNPMTGNSETIELYDRAIDRLLRYHPDVIELMSRLNSDGRPVPMASALLAYLHLMSTDADDLSTARAACETLSQTGGNDRERAHAAAISAWSQGDWKGAASLLDSLLRQWPTDVLAVMIGHQLDFFLGDAQNLRDRPMRSLREFEHDHPHAPFVAGMTPAIGYPALTSSTGLSASPRCRWAKAQVWIA
jgi:hypothetical protein